MPADQATSPADITLMTVSRRGLSRRCPNCGKGAVLSGYLTRVPVCGYCGEDLSQISADDGPAWATLIVVGHMLAPFLIILGRDERIPVWVAIAALAAMMPKVTTAGMADAFVAQMKKDLVFHFRMKI